MLSEDFYGKKPFVWWVGCVEDRIDPLKMGCLRVRIIGLHPKEKELVPTSALPWAQQLHPTTGAQTSSGPREGDWVWGFFQDGEAAQIPVVVGVFSGIDQAVNVAGKTFVQQKNEGFVGDGLSAAQVEAGPKPKENVDTRVSGKPATYPNLSRGIVERTGVYNTNSSLSHACDVKAIANAKIAKDTFLAKAIEKIRQAIRALIKALGFDPTGLVSQAISILQGIQAELKRIRDYIKVIADMIKRIFNIINLLRAILSFILSLPARLIKFVLNCIKKVFNDIKQLISSAVGIDGLPSLTELKQEIQTTGQVINDTFNAASNLLNANSALTPAAENIVNGLSDISSIEDLNTVTSDIGKYISSEVSAAATQFTSSQFNMNTDPNTPVEPTPEL
jgi:hypothetical protein